MRSAGWPRRGRSRSGLDISRVVVEPPRDPSHGDLATNAAMVLAKEARMNPRALAELLVADLQDDPRVTKVEIAGPGFINITLAPAVLHEVLRAVVVDSGGFGRTRAGRGRSGERGICLGQSRPARCMWAIAAARSSAMRLPGCSILPATRSPASTTSTTPARRSMFSPARPTSATGRPWARRSARSRRASIRATT